MDDEALRQAVDRFNEDQDRFAVGMGYVAAGIGSVQLFCQHVGRGTLEGPRHLPLLIRAQEMLQRSQNKISGQAEVKALVDKYVEFIEALIGLVDPDAAEDGAPED